MKTASAVRRHLVSPAVRGNIGDLRRGQSTALMGSASKAPKISEVGTESRQTKLKPLSARVVTQKFAR